MKTANEHIKQELSVKDASYQADLELISSVAREAGAIGLRYFGKDPKVWTKEGGSPVSEADLAVDHFIKQKLLEARPDYGWLSEETADDRNPIKYKRTFVVDPIDGTRGYLHNNPQWCVSIAVVEDGHTVAGVLECPALNEHYLATLDGKVTLNGRNIQGAALANDNAANAEQKAVPANARISCRDKDLQRFLPELEKKVEQVDHIPSLAYRLVLLAQDKLDIVLVRPGSHDWDIAAVDLILRNCGGALVNDKGEEVLFCQQTANHKFLIGLKQDNLEAVLDEVAS